MHLGSIVLTVACLTVPAQLWAGSKSVHEKRVNNKPLEEKSNNKQQPMHLNRTKMPVFLLNNDTQWNLRPHYEEACF